MLFSLIAASLAGQYCAAPVAAPAYGYAYQNQYQYAYQAPAFVDKVFFVAVEPAPAYYGGLVAQSIRNADAAKEQAERDRKIDAILGAVQQSPPAPTPTVPPAPEPDPKPDVKPGPPAASLMSRPSPPKGEHAGIALARSRCAACHSGPKARAGYSLFDDNGAFTGNVEMLAKANAAVVDGTMPPKKRLDGAEVAAIKSLLADTVTASVLGGR